MKYELLTLKLKILELFRQKIKLEEIQRYLQEEQQKSPWYLCESDLSVTNIINHLKMVLRNEQYRHNG